MVRSRREMYPESMKSFEGDIVCVSPLELPISTNTSRRNHPCDQDRSFRPNDLGVDLESHRRSCAIDIADPQGTANIEKIGT